MEKIKEKDYFKMGVDYIKNEAVRNLNENTNSWKDGYMYLSFFEIKFCFCRNTFLHQMFVDIENTKNITYITKRKLYEISESKGIKNNSYQTLSGPVASYSGECEFDFVGRKIKAIGKRPVGTPEAVEIEGGINFYLI